MDLGRFFFQFLNLSTQSVGFLGRDISPSQGLYLHTGQAQTQTFMHSVGFEPSVRAGKNSSYLTPHGLSDRRYGNLHVLKSPLEILRSFVPV
jgi:hypothetical protein